MDETKTIWVVECRRRKLWKAVWLCGALILLTAALILTPFSPALHDLAGLVGCGLVCALGLFWYLATRSIRVMADGLDFRMSFSARRFVRFDVVQALEIQPDQLVVYYENRLDPVLISLYDYELSELLALFKDRVPVINRCQPVSFKLDYVDPEKRLASLPADLRTGKPRCVFKMTKEFVFRKLFACFVALGLVLLVRQGITVLEERFQEAMDPVIYVIWWGGMACVAYLFFRVGVAAAQQLIIEDDRITLKKLFSEQTLRLDELAEEGMVCGEGCFLREAKPAGEFINFPVDLCSFLSIKSLLGDWFELREAPPTLVEMFVGESAGIEPPLILKNDFSWGWLWRIMVRCFLGLSLFFWPMAVFAESAQDEPISVAFAPVVLAGLIGLLCLLQKFQPDYLVYKDRVEVKFGKKVTVYGFSDLEKVEQGWFYFKKVSKRRHRLKFPSEIRLILKALFPDKYVRQKLDHELEPETQTKSELEVLEKRGRRLRFLTFLDGTFYVFVLICIMPAQAFSEPPVNLDFFRVVFTSFALWGVVYALCFKRFYEANKDWLDGVRLHGDKNKAYAYLMFFLIGALLSALVNIEVLGFGRLLWGGGFITLIALPWIWSKIKKIKYAWLLAGLIMMGVFLVSSVVLYDVNYLYDFNEKSLVPAKVTTKAGGDTYLVFNYENRDYELKMPILKDGEGRPTFDAGQPVTLHIYPGALGIPWIRKVCQCTKHTTTSVGMAK